MKERLHRVRQALASQLGMRDADSAGRRSSVADPLSARCVKG